ncbi:hypothetical protein V6N11_056274 [Hibiscus sabdariffa]|uniref:Uncharacterized protein n=1 Tax=Hibiscus sabdariffa TaxID=183260 RepID=A0ABR2T452_9ROSI
MGTRTDSVFVIFHGSDDSFGSRWWESRSWPTLGRRMVRLGTPSLGGWNLVHCHQVWDEKPGAKVNGGCYVCAHIIFVLQDLPNWLVAPDRYKDGDRRFEGSVQIGKRLSEGSVKLQGLEKWHSDGSVVFRLMGKRNWKAGFDCDYRESWKNRNGWSEIVTKRRYRGTVQGNRKEENNRRKSLQGKIWKLETKRALFVWCRRCVDVNLNFLGGHGRRRYMQTTTMESTSMKKSITCDWSEKVQKACENYNQYKWDTGQFEEELGPAVMARETFPDFNDIFQDCGLCWVSTCAWGQRWILGECPQFHCSLFIAPDILGMLIPRARDATFYLRKEREL